jgi:hypothetical protein
MKDVAEEEGRTTQWPGCWTEDPMRHLRGKTSPEDVVTSLNYRKRLITMVTTLVREVERLHEDNSQLRAAIALYREVARQSLEDRR